MAPGRRRDVRPSVLIVDDHDSFRSLARKMLETAGFAVTEASTGAEATEAAASGCPRIVLLDIQRPDINGFDVAERLARQGRPKPVIVLTSTRDPSDFGRKIAAAPVAGFLPKEQLSGDALLSFLPGLSP